MISLFANFAGRFGINPKEAERFAKFLVVGTLGFIIDFGTLTFLIEVVDIPGLIEQNTPFPATVGLVLANTISFTLAVLSNFTFNRYWTYPESRSKKKRIQLPQFALVSILGLIINNIIFILATPIFDSIFANIDFLGGSIAGYIPAKILATIVVLFWNFFVNRFWTFDNVGRE
jgi:putative flippase GtrA